MLFQKFKEILFIVLPVIIIVLLLNFTVAPLETTVLIRFFIGAFFIIIGLSIFLFGVEIGITPIGNLIGSKITKTNKIWIVIVAGLILGFSISITEPDLHIVAGQIDSITSGQIARHNIIIVVSLGIAGMLTIGLVRIVKNIHLNKILTILYGAIFILGLCTSPEFLAIAFDTSGATTGAMTVPFILALAAGVSGLKKDSKASEEDSFGLIGIASTGPIISVMFMNVFSKTDELKGSLEHIVSSPSSILAPFIRKLPHVSGEILLALIPILIIFLIFQKISFKLSEKAFNKILKGLLYTFIGLVFFLLGVNASFMDIGSTMGYKIASLENKYILVFIGFIMGAVIILAEPAVHLLTHQIESVTSGYVKRKFVLIAFSAGIGFAVALSMLRILIPEIHLWHYLLPGYFIAIIMTYFVPGLFVGIAFDSGGVASGPMTATFVMAFTQGAAEAIEGANILTDGLGMIATVALTPIIALQILGFIFKIKSRKEGIVKHGK